MFRPLLLAASLTCISFGAKAHEFWIAPAKHQVAPSDDIVAALIVGQDFAGNSQAYLPRSFERFDFMFEGRVVEVEGRLGDRPAMRVDAPGDGLVVVVHETTDLGLTWDEWEKFVAFVEHKDAEWTLQAHEARGLSKDSVREVYSRYAKSLVGVGGSAGSDFVAGLETEIVALENPYTDDMSDGIDVRLLYQGVPRRNEQIEIYERNAAGEVSVSTVRTDMDGVASVPVNPGSRYMLDAVVLREPVDQIYIDRNVAWESLWANITFGVPAN